MGKRRWILWQSLMAPGMERFIIGATPVRFEGDAGPVPLQRKSRSTGSRSQTRK